MVCEAVSGYICNMEIYSAEEEVGGHSVITLDRNLAKIITSIKTIFITV